MSIEITMLLCAVALTLAQVVIAAGGASLQVGLPALAGNREDLPVITGWAGRAARAHRNMLENLVLFGILILIATTTGHTNAMTALGAKIFLWARIAYLLIFLAGIPWLRTVSWVVSVAGLLLILVQLS